MMMKALLTTLVLGASPVSDTLEFTVHVDNDEGEVRCAVYDASGDWLTRRVRTGTSARIVGRKAVCVFADLPPGSYAISAYHDEDGDGRLDTNLLGVPSEDYCASRGARGTFGPPAYEDAVFDYEGGRLSLSAKAE